METNDIAAQRGIRWSIIGIIVNSLLAAIKAIAGILGNSYALIADAIESTTDIFTSVMVMVGLKLSRKPADESHPYGHGKFEPLAAIGVSLMLFASAIVIAIESVQEIVTPHHAPAPFTLAVLVGVVVVKETLFRSVLRVGESVESLSVQSDAWHHRSDAITSALAFLGISIAIIGGEGYEPADDFAALIAAAIISLNAFMICRPALHELLDTSPDRALVEQVRAIARSVHGVLGTHKCRIRKVGFDYIVDLEILCDPEASIRTGHEIAHATGDAIKVAIPSVARVMVHVEPVDDFGKRSIDSLGT